MENSFSVATISSRSEQHCVSNSEESPGVQTERHTDRQTDKHTEKQMDSVKPTHRQTDREMDRKE